MPEILIFSLVLLVMVFTLAWAVQWTNGNAGYVDVAWSFSTGLTGLAYLLAGGGDPLPRLAAGARSQKYDIIDQQEKNVSDPKPILYD